MPVEGSRESKVGGRQSGEEVMSRKSEVGSWQWSAVCSLLCALRPALCNLTFEFCVLSFEFCLLSFVFRCQLAYFLRKKVSVCVQ